MAAELNDAALEMVERVLTDYLDQVEPEHVDTADLADNIISALRRMGTADV